MPFGSNNPSAIATLPVKTVLYGDSMTEQYQTMSVAVSASYAPLTGFLTVNFPNHQQATGWYVRLFNRQYASLLIGRRLPVTRIDANNFIVPLPANLPDLPTGVLGGNTQYRAESWQSAQGFVTWLQMFLAWRLNIVNNGAQSGDTTDNALDRLQADCLSFKPSLVVMQIPGINDMSIGNGPVADETISTNQRLLVDRILGIGAALVLNTLTPVAAGESRANLQNMQRVMRLNRRLRDYVMGKSNVVLCDAWSQIVDPANATALAQTALLRSAPDNIHYSMRGSRLIGEYVGARIAQYFAFDSNTLPKSRVDSFLGSAVTLSAMSRTSNIVTATSVGHGWINGEIGKVQGGTSENLNLITPITAVDANTVRFASTGANGAITGTASLGRDNNLFANPTLFDAVGGTIIAPVTGTAPNLIRVQNLAGAPTVAASVIARADGYGNNLQCIAQAAAPSDQFSVEVDFTPATAVLPLQVAVDREYIAECAFSLTGVAGSNVSELRWNLQAIVDGITYPVYALNGYAEGAVINTDLPERMCRTAVLKMPSGTVSNFKFQFSLTFSAAGTPITLTFGQPAIREYQSV